VLDMANTTPFSNIYARFRRKITDYRITLATQDLAENVMYGWLESAISNFVECKTNLKDRDIVLQQFNQLLLDIEEEILSLLMVIEWIRPEINNILDLKTQLSDTDFKVYSAANFLKEKQSLLNESQKEINQKTMDYAYRNSDIAKLFSGQN
jgi:RNA processing factor Prp31